MRLAHKQQLIIVQHDGGFRSESAFATLQQAVNASHASDGQTAVGIATLLGFEDACAEIKVCRPPLLSQPQASAQTGLRMGTFLGKRMQMPKCSSIKM